MLACTTLAPQSSSPVSEWLDPRRNVFELGGKLPPALRKGLEGTLGHAGRASPHSAQSTMASRVSASMSLSGPGKVG